MSSPFSVQGPREGVGDVDALAPLPLGSRSREGGARIAVVGVEEREFQIGVDTVRGEELRLGSHQVELTLGVLVAADRGVEVAERDHVLR